MEASSQILAQEAEFFAGEVVKRSYCMLLVGTSIRPKIIDFALLGGSASRMRGTHGIETVEGLEPATELLPNFVFC